MAARDLAFHQWISLCLLLFVHVGLPGVAPQNFTKDPKTGNFKILAKQLKIVNLDDGKSGFYWIAPVKDTDPAELKKIVWLEATGEVPAEPGKTYEVSFTVSLTDNAQFWDKCPVYVVANVGGSEEQLRENNWGEASLFNITPNVRTDIPPPLVKASVSVNTNLMYKTLQFGLYDIWCNEWKTGLRIHEANVNVVVPK